MATHRDHHRAGLGIGANGTSEAFAKLPGRGDVRVHALRLRPRALGRARARRRPRGAAAGRHGAVRLPRQRSRAADAAHVGLGRAEHRPARLVHEPLPGLRRCQQPDGRALHRKRTGFHAGAARDRQTRPDLRRRRLLAAQSLGQIAGASNAAFAKADVAIDAVPSATDIDAALAKLEAAAKSRGVAVGVATALPVSIDRIASGRRPPRRAHHAGAGERGCGETEVELRKRRMASGE